MQDEFSIISNCLSFLSIRNLIMPEGEQHNTATESGSVEGEGGGIGEGLAFASGNGSGHHQLSARSTLPSLDCAPPLRLDCNELRAIILDYLSHSTYVDSAIAFVKEATLSDTETKQGVKASQKEDDDVHMADTNTDSRQPLPSYGHASFELDIDTIDGEEKDRSDASALEIYGNSDNLHLTRREIRLIRVRRGKEKLHSVQNYRLVDLK